MSQLDTFELDIEPLSKTPRRIMVYLPTGYNTTTKPYPVLYMFDGHNVFLDEYATYGTSWGFKKYLDETHLQLIVVGVDCNHEGRKRLDEYCPIDVPSNSWIGQVTPNGQLTANWFMNTLKPYIEQHYNVSSNRNDVGIGGSSMGGLMAIYMISKYSNIFSKAACVSPTMDINFEHLSSIVQTNQIHEDTRIYLDFGSEEVKKKQTMAQCLDRLLILNHHFTTNGATTFPNIVVGGMHNEATWSTIVPLFLEYLYPNLYKEL